MSIDPVPSSASTKDSLTAVRQAGQVNPLVMCACAGIDQWEQIRDHLAGRCALVWARSDVQACELLKRHGEQLAAIIVQSELPGSELDGLKLVRLVRGMLSRRGLPEYAHTVPVMRRVPLFVLAETKAGLAGHELSELGDIRLLTLPVNREALSVALQHATMGALDLPVASLAMAASAPRASMDDLRVPLLDEELRERLERALAVLSAQGAEQPSADDAGLEHYRAAALCLAVLDLLPQPARARGLEAVGLRRAAAASLLAEMFHIERHHAVALGMLLDAALFARARHCIDAALDVIEMPAIARAAREHATGHLPHPVTSAYIARTWQMNEDEVKAIEAHHHEQPPQHALGRLSWLAERVAAVHEAGDAHFGESLVLSGAVQLGLPEDRVREVIRCLPAETERLAEAFGCSARLGSGPTHSECGNLAALHHSYLGMVRLLESVVAERDGLAARLRDANTRLAEHAATDQLTRLANRQAFEQALRRKLKVAESAALPLSLIFVDIDHFRELNDDHGNQFGDEVLCAVADVVRRSIRSGDFCARYGGEEFAVILLGAGLDLASRVAERLRDCIGSSRISSGAAGRPLRVTASCSVVVTESPKPDSCADALVARAAATMYEAKGAGRNCVKSTAL